MCNASCDLSSVIIVWPCLSLPAGVFPKGYFAFWVVISLIWGVMASIVIIGMPLWEGRFIFRNICYGLAGVPVPPTQQEKFKLLEMRVARLEEAAGIAPIVNVEPDVDKIATSPTSGSFSTHAFTVSEA